jgi:hypothetical protein
VIKITASVDQEVAKRIMPRSSFGGYDAKEGLVWFSWILERGREEIRAVFTEPERRHLRILARDRKIDPGQPVVSWLVASVAQHRAERGIRK